jgi:monoamine oxidase
LAQHNLDFVILEASDKIGGRIGTEKLVDVMKKEFGREDDYPKWINSNKKVLNTPIEYGATWISQEHTFMLRILKEFKIRVFPQYYDGLSIYGKEAGKY